MTVRRFVIEQKNKRLRLDDFLYQNIGAFSRMFLRRAIEQNQVKINGETKPPGYHLQPNDRIEIEFDEQAETAMTAQDLLLDIVFEDAEILVVNKPAGMLVHPTKHERTGTLANALAFHLNRAPESETSNLKFEISNPHSALRTPHLIRPGLVHRLDKETSGLLVVAKTARAHRILSDHFARRLIKKLYLARVNGIVAPNAGEIETLIDRFADKPHWRAAETGKAARTQFRVAARGIDSTLLELEPVTGRTNQLRIHCACFGHPIVGDEWYGGKHFSRLCLHAQKLAFNHPNGGWLEFACDAPAEFDF